MSRNTSLLQRAIYILCLAYTFVIWDNLSASEFGGGAVTGLTTKLCGLGIGLGILALFGSLISQYLNNILIVLSILFCLPMTFYELAPGLMHMLTPAIPSSTQDSFFVWNHHAALNLLLLVAAGSFAIRNFFITMREAKL